MVRPGPPHRTGLRTGSEGARGEGRRGRPGGLRIRSSPRRPGPPGSRGPAVGSSQAADQMGIARRTRGRSLSPARPIPATEGSDRRAANTRGSARAGRGCLRATSARGGCGSRGVTAGGGRARNRALGAGRRLCGQGQEAGAECCQLAQLAAPVAAQNRGLAGRRPPPPPQAPEGALRAESHSQAEALGAPSLTGARAPPPPRCSLGWSVSFTGNSRRRQPPTRQRVGRRAGGRLSTSCTAHPPQELGSAQVEPRWGPGFLGAEERRAPGSSSPPSRPLLPDTTPSLPPVTPLPLLGLLSLPISLLYAILRD